MLDSMERECQKEFPNSVFAKEGMDVQVSVSLTKANHLKEVWLLKSY
jgi:hypothetical protein